LSAEDIRVKRSTNDQAAGKLHEIKARVGAVTKDDDLKVEGESEKLKGKAQGLIGRVEKAVGT
jgi:uncharacterized protein YjbJ (UPF0337 family)